MIIDNIKSNRLEIDNCFKGMQFAVFVHYKTICDLVYEKGPYLWKKFSEIRVDKHTQRVLSVWRYVFHIFFLPRASESWNVGSVQNITIFFEMIPPPGTVEMPDTRTRCARRHYLALFYRSWSTRGFPPASCGTGRRWTPHGWTSLALGRSSSVCGLSPTTRRGCVLTDGFTLL